MAFLQQSREFSLNIEAARLAEMVCTANAPSGITSRVFWVL